MTPGEPSRNAPVGILMLDTRFPRPPGDIGNVATWPFPVAYETVPGANVERAVRHGGEGLLEPFVEAGERVVARGARLVTTSCGFLAPFGPTFAERLGVPVVASSLVQARWIASVLPPGRRVGILTIAASSLAPAILEAADVPPDCPVGTLEGGHFADAILNDRDALDMDASRTEHVAAARELVAKHPDVGALLLECTNMPPHAAAIAEATGLPVFSIVTAVTLARMGMAPPRFLNGR